MRISFIAAIFIFLGMTGCTTTHPALPDETYAKNGNDPAMVRLNQIAEKAEQSQQVLAEIQRSQATSSIALRGATPVMTATPYGWEKHTNVSFQGPFNKLVYTLSTRSGYQYFTQGSRPANIPLVTIDARDKSLKQILDDVITQLPPTINIAIYPATHSIVVSYHAGR